MFKYLHAALGQSLKGFATVLGVNRTKMDNAIGSNIVEPGQDGSNIKIQHDTYELAALDIDDVIKLGNTLPKGARIIQIIVTHDALGGSTTLDIGDGEDDDRYDTAIDTSSSGQVFCDNIAGKGYEIGTIALDNQIQATLEGAAGTGSLVVDILYAHA